MSAPLQPDPATPGLWHDPTWLPGDPGAFAVVAGVSAYRHLDGGPAPAPDTYGLGQLQVSALTAYRFFLWLRDAYRFERCAPVRCWLLLSPTQAELAVEPGLAAHAAPADFLSCKAAVADWFAAMQGLDPASAKGSRAFFFFSGHGLERFPDEQILMAADYLAPPLANPDDNAISTRNLYVGMASLDVPCQFLFADACRNDHQRLLQQEVDGVEILPVARNHRAKRRIAPILYASASGSRAWQPQQPAAGAEGLSLFGRALLDGLRAEEGFEAPCDGDACAVNLFPLQTFVNRRVAALLAGFGSAEEQPVMLGGSLSDTVVTHVARPAPSRGGQAPPPSPPTVAESEAAVFQIEHRLDDLRPLPGEMFAAQATLLDPAGQPVGTTTPHAVFGSESVTGLWEQCRVFSLRRGEWLAAGEDFSILQVAHHEQRGAYRVELTIPADAGTHWLQLPDRAWAGTNIFACLLPADRIAPRYLLTLGRDLAAQDHPVVRLDAALALDNPAGLGTAARLWERYRTTNIAEAAAAIDLGFLEAMLQAKGASPLAATVAAALLLRAGRLDLLHDWPRNLADWFPEMPDGPVLWLEQTWRQTAGEPEQADVDRWLALAERGLPTLADAFGYAVQQAADLAAMDILDADRRQRVQETAEHLRPAARFFRSGGLFATFAGPAAEVTPDLVAPWNP